MRHIVAGFAAAAIFAVAPTLVVAGNQEIANQIVHRLRDGGQMSDYNISVVYKDGTARLQGRVASEEQMITALKVAFQTPGVTSVVNELAVAPSSGGQSSTSVGSAARASGDLHNPLRSKTVMPVAEDTQPLRKPALAKRLDSWAGGSETEANTSPNADPRGQLVFQPDGRHDGIRRGITTGGPGENGNAAAC